MANRNPLLDIRVFDTLSPSAGNVVMVQVDEIVSGVANVSLLEYNNRRGRIAAGDDTVVHLIFPAVVNEVPDDAPIVLTRASFKQKNKCESIYNSQKFVETILADVSRTLPQSDEDLKLHFLKLWPTLDALSNPEFLDNLPKRLRRKLKNSLRRIKLFTWRIKKPALLSPCIDYRVGICWAIALVRQLEALLKIKGLIPKNQYLSIQDLLDKTPDGLLDDEGDITCLEDAEYPLCYRGIVGEQHRPLTYAIGYGPATFGADVPAYTVAKFKVYYDSKYKARKWDEMIIKKLEVAPFAATVLWFESYRNNPGNMIYKPTDEEWERYLANPKDRSLLGHTMLLTGHGVDENGVAYLEFQDTNGVVGNDRGFVRFARFPSLVVEFVGMKLPRI